MSREDRVLIIGVEEEVVFLELYQEANQDRVSSNREEWRNDGSSSEKLLERIDVFLKKNGLSVNELSKVETEIDENQKYTLVRIIETVANTVNYCLKIKKL